MRKGKTTRKVGETAWLMTRGKGLPILDHGVSHGIILTEEDLPLVLEAPRRGHSQKPDEAYHAIERLYGDVRRLDIRGSAICPHRALTRHVRTQAASRLDKLEQRPRGRIRERAGERVREQTGEQNTTCISRRLNLPRHTTYRLGPSAGPWPAASSRSIASSALAVFASTATTVKSTPLSTICSSNDNAMELRHAIPEE
jgi:hypothetical protein